MRRAVLAVYRGLVRLAPRDVCERFGDEQVQLFEQLWRAERPRSGVRATLWTAAHLWKAGRAVVSHWLDRLVWRRERGDLTMGGRAGGGWRAPAFLDVRLAVRGLWRSPVYSITVVAVLAFTVALVTTAFAVVDGVLFKPLPYVRAAELNLVRAESSAKPSVDSLAVAGADVAAWMDALPGLQTAALSTAWPSFEFQGREYSQVQVDEHFFEVLGVRPLFGTFAAEDFNLKSPESSGGVWTTMIVSHRLWVGRYGADPSLIGRAVTTGVREGFTFGYRIRGVLPPDFVFPLDVGETSPDVLVPFHSSGLRNGLEKEFHLIARLRPTANLVEVRDRLLTASRRRAVTPPPVDPEFAKHHEVPDWRPIFDNVRLLPLTDYLGWRNRTAFRTVFAGAAVLVLLACVNIAGLAAARSLDRRREFAVRRALGASGWALVRSFVAEVAVLAGISAAAALLLARPLLQQTLALLPVSMTSLKTPAIDVRVFVAVTMVAVLTVVLVVWWPALVAHRVSLPMEFGRGGTTATRPGRSSHLALVAAQVALTFILFVAGGLTVTSLARTWRAEAGYDRDRLLVLPAFGRYDVAGADERLRALQDVLRREPGVGDVAASNIQMFWPGISLWSSLAAAGDTSRPENIQSSTVDDHYFNVMGLRVIEGRLPVPGEWSARSAVAIVSETAARRFWPGRSAIGQILTPWNAKPKDAPVKIQVIGVVNDARYHALDEDPIGAIYLPDPISRSSYGSFFVVRTAGRASELLPHLIGVVTSNGFAVERPMTVRDALFVSVKHRVLPAWIFGSLGGIAIVVLAVGVLGLLATAAARRTREIGIRVALGSTSTRIVSLLVREQMRAVGIGLLAGLVVSLWAVRGLESSLYGVRLYDPAVWAAVAIALAIVATAGTVLPAARATRVDPVIVLRSE